MFQKYKRKGAVLILVAICLVALLGVVAVVIDGGMLFEEKRHGQAAADAGALAGAVNLFKNYQTDRGEDSSGTAKKNAQEVVRINGFDSANATVDIRLYGEKYLGGPKAGTDIPKGYIEVTITSIRDRYFSRIFGSGDLQVQARAVARGMWKTPDFGILILEPSAKDSFFLSGSQDLDVIVNGGIVKVNSNAKGANQGAVDINSNTTLQAVELNVYGDANVAGTLLDPLGAKMEAVEDEDPTPDPLAPLPDVITYEGSIPVAPAPIEYKNIKGTVDEKINNIINDKKVTDDAKEIFQTLKDLKNQDAAGLAKVNALLENTNNIYILYPGKYSDKGSGKLPTQPFSNGDLVIMLQANESTASDPELKGIYYLERGFASNTANIIEDPRYPNGSGGGLMLYNVGTGKDDDIAIAGGDGGVVELTGLTGSGKYENLLVFQNRTSTTPVTIKGNGTFNMLGGYYSANAEIAFSGNGGSYTVASQVIARYASFGGNGSLLVDYSQRKATPIRILDLVE